MLTATENVDFLDISPFISLLASGGPSSDILLGDANQNGVVNFLDISPFISLLTSNTFLDQADINRDGNVDFLDISPFINLLNSGAIAQGKLANGGSTAKSEAIVAKPSASSVAPDSKVESNGPVASTDKRSIATGTLRSKYDDAGTLESAMSQRVRVIAASAEAPLVLVNNPVTQASELTVVDTAAAGPIPVDIFIGPVAFGLSNYSFAGAGDASLRGFESKGPLVARRPLVGSAERLDFSPKLRDSLELCDSLVKPPSANVSIEDSFSTAAELFDAHPESLNGVFDFELEETFAGLID